MGNRRDDNDPARARMLKERLVLLQLRRLGQASKGDLAGATGISLQTTVDITNALVRGGLVRKLGKRLGRVGQPSILYAINPNGVFGLGLHVARARQELVLVDFEGGVRMRRAGAHLLPHVDDILALLAAGLQEFLDAGIPFARISGVGIALSHDLWYRPDRQGLPADLLAEWDRRDVAAEAREQLGLAVYVENDTRVAAIAEYLIGGGQEFDTFLYVSIGANISGALVLGGDLETGAHGNAAALGAIPVGPSRLAHASRPGSAFLGERASLSGLIRHLHLHGFTIRAVSDLPDLVDQARGLVQEWLDDCVEALVEGLTACFAVIDVEAVIVDSLLPQYLVMEIVERLDRRLQAARPPGLVVPRLRLSRLAADAALLGSAILPIDAHFIPGREDAGRRAAAGRRRQGPARRR